jgi:acyl-CoA reductase-like NAD-dependent aldehyde dehydrogenase
VSEIVCLSPVDGGVIVKRRSANESEIVATVEAARKAQRAWAATALAERKRKILIFLEAIKARNAEIVPELTMQMGRPVRYGGELRSFEERVRALVALSDDALAPISPAPKAGFRRMVKRTPLGLVLVVAPWNYPYLTAVNAIVPALLAGNAVILKHAAQTLLVGDRFQEAMNQADLPQHLFTTLALDHETTGRLIASRSVDHICFTGSVEGGKAIARAAADTFATVGLELGGKDPAYVRADADFDDAVANLVDGAFYNSGQSCCGVERVYVQAPLYDRFVEAFVALTNQYRLGDPREEATTLGPMAATRFADVVRNHTAEAVAKGARPLIDPAGFAADRPGTAYLAPQVLVGVDHSMKAMTEESFGPLVGIMKVGSDDEALALMNDSPYGLTASIWTKDVEAVERLGDQIATGTVYMNRCDYIDPELAWTGVKNTGAGAGMGPFGFAAMTQPKSFHLRLAQ